MTQIIDLTTLALSCDDGLPIGLDLYRPSGRGELPLVLLCHGFKGFRRWGMFPHLAERLAAGGRCVALLDLSHNGTAPGDETEFVRLDLFESQTPGRHVDDLRAVIAYLSTSTARAEYGLTEGAPFVVGHSMGGGLGVLLAAAGEPLAGLATLNGIGHFLRLSAEAEDELRRTGQVVVPNARTGQDMPLGQAWFDQARAIDEDSITERVACPVLVVQGDQDIVVTPAEGHDLAARLPGARLHTVTGGGHTFGAQHPWTGWTDELADVADALDGFISG